MSTHFFLGANSGGGFFSLYDEFSLRDDLHDLIVLKGGPGMGKSTFMKTIGACLEAAGAEAEYIHCSGDPDSLDAVYFPQLSCAILDGTPPHAVEPRFPIALDRCVDLGQFCDVDGCKVQRGAILARSRACSDFYARAYRCLHARRAIEAEIRSVAAPCFPLEKAMRRMRGILARELHARKGNARGALRRRLLGGATCQGWLWRFDTVEAVCPRIYAFQDSFGLAAPLLTLAAETALGYGYDVIACPNADFPDTLQHVLIPQAQLSFLTAERTCRPVFSPYRHIRLDAMAESGITKADRSRIRFLRRIERSMENDVFDTLRHAKASHDALEALYRPLVSFDGIDALATAEGDRLLQRFSSML